MFESYTRIWQIQDAARKAGDFTFGKREMRGFNSRVLETIYGGRFFVMSSRFVGSNGRKGVREYTAYECQNGEINKVSKPTTRYLAIKAAQEAAAQATQNALESK